MCCCNEKNPVGTVNYFARQFPPEGWLLCDGREVSRDVFVDLYNMVGTSFGTGDGKTTFNLPDLRGEFIRGLDEGRGVDKDRTFGSEQIDTLQNMTGDFDGVASTTGAAAGAGLIGSGVLSTTGNGAGQCAYDHVMNYNRTVTFDASKVARTSTETRPRNVALLACIKY